MENKRFSGISKLFRSPGGIYFAIIAIAFAAFELFNFSTTQYAFDSIFSVQDMNWSFILAVAFCGMDFAGIARLFTPEQGNDEPVEVWFLFGAWLLAAAMNATLTWWAVSIAIYDKTLPGFVGAEFKQVVPVFVAILVWIIRVLLIGSFAIHGDALIHQKKHVSTYQPQKPTQQSQKPAQYSTKPTTPYSPPSRPTFSLNPKNNLNNKQEPTYRNLYKGDED